MTEVKTYTGTKTVKASAMTRAAYNEYRGWTLPADENGDDEGYLVEYADGGTPNHAAHDGYISWSPKEQFERAYRESGTWQQRLQNEFDDLTTRLVDLTAFVVSAKFGDLSADAREALIAQQGVMEAYRGVLEVRLQDAGVLPVEN